MNIFRLRLVSKAQSLKTRTQVDIGKVSEILAVRQQAIEEIVDCAHRYIDKYSDPSKVVCKHREDLCDSTSLGSITRAFKSAKIYPDASKLMNMSLEHIKCHTSGIRMVPIADWYSGKVAPGCCGSPKRNFAHCSKCNKRLSSSSSCPSCNRTFLGGSCTECHQTYTPAVRTTNHLSCIPLEVVKAEMDLIVDKITGLKYSDFVPSNTENRQTLATNPGLGAGDLWESLVFQ